MSRTVPSQTRGTENRGPSDGGAKHRVVQTPSAGVHRAHGALALPKSVSEIDGGVVGAPDAGVVAPELPWRSPSDKWIRCGLVVVGILGVALVEGLGIAGAVFHNDSLTRMAEAQYAWAWAFLFSVAGFYLGSKPITAAWHFFQGKLR